MLDSQTRLKIARELHDGVVQDLVAFGYSLDSVIARSDISTAARAELRRVRLDASDLVKKMREEIFFLRQIDENIYDQLQEIFSNSAITLIINGDLPQLISPFNSELFLVIREIALNTLKFARAKRFIISTELKNDWFEITIEDDGIGRAENIEGHFGLTNIKERITLLGGIVKLHSSDSGTQFKINIPQQVVISEDDKNISSG